MSTRRFPLSESSSIETEGRKIAVNDEGNARPGVSVPVGEGGDDEKKDDTDGDANETPARKVAVDKNVELALFTSSASNGSSKDTGP